MKILLVVITFLFWGVVIAFTNPITVQTTIVTVLLVGALLIVAISLIIFVVKTIMETK